MAKTSQVQFCLRDFEESEVDQEEERVPQVIFDDNSNTTATASEVVLTVDPRVSNIEFPMRTTLTSLFRINSTSSVYFFLTVQAFQVTIPVYLC